MEVTEESKPIIKKEVITREIHQWRKPDGTFAEKDETTTAGSTVHLTKQLKTKLTGMKQSPDESYGSLIERLIRDHFMLQILKRKLQEKNNETRE